MTNIRQKQSSQKILLASLFIATSGYASHAYADESTSSTINNSLNYSSDNALLLEQYKDNFVLPFYYTQSPNYKEYQSVIPDDGKLSKYNVNFQISLKYRLLSGILYDNDQLFFAYTQRSNWQAYASSAFFRDTEYEPSVFWTFPTETTYSNNFHYAGSTLGLVHQSNGRGGEQERSWNRAFIDITFKKDALTLSIKPWARLDFGAKDYNKDITNYLGYGRVSMNWNIDGKTMITFTVRNALESGFSRGYEKVTLNFPIYKRLRGYLMFESGYGISISDYNHYDNAGGIGFSF